MSNPSSIHRGWNRNVADLTHADTGNVLEALVPGDGTNTASRQLHIAQSTDGCTDWGLAAQADPMLVLHSSTTPITDYATLTHDGTSLLLNTAGGTLALQVDGTTEITLSGTILDLAGVNLQLQACGDILDNGGNESLSFVTTASAVNEFTMTNAAACNPPALSVTGGSTNIGLCLITKGTGVLSLAALATGSVVVNDGGVDVDFRVEADCNANMIVTCGATDNMGFGGAVTAGAFLTLIPGAQSRDMVTSVGMGIHVPAESTSANVSGCDTIAIGSHVFVGIPTWTGAANTLTVTEGATLYVSGAPVGGANVTLTAGHSIWVDGGSVRMDGVLQLGNAGSDTGSFRMEGATSGAVTHTVAAAAGTYSLEWPVDDGCCGEQLTTSGSGVLTWAAASTRESKDIHGRTCKAKAYQNVLNVGVYDYTYKPEIAAQGKWTGNGQLMTGIIADEAPWAMQGVKKQAFSPINAFGQLTAAFQLLANRVDALESCQV